MLGPHLLVLAV